MHLWDIVLIGFILSLTAGIGLQAYPSRSAAGTVLWEQTAFAEK
jgi:hypothetical protein